MRPIWPICGPSGRPIFGCGTFCSSQFAAERETPTWQRPPYIRKQALAVKDTLSIASIGRTKLYELLNDGTLKSVKVGRKRLILRDSLDALLTPEAA